MAVFFNRPLDPDEVKRRIESARSPDNKFLNLEGANLTDVPEIIGEFTHLEGLDLGEQPSNDINVSVANQLAVLPEWIGNLTKLRWLYLGNNKLTSLPDSLRKLTCLRELKIQRNSLTIVPEWIGNFTQLEYLDLNENQLTVLPESLGQLTKLQTLHLYHNELTMLPESLGRLSQLQVLSFHGNKLKELPEYIGKLYNLNTLYIGDAHGGIALAEIPLFIRQLKKLVNFCAGHCNLKSLPNWIDELTTINRLLLFGNFLTDLPRSFANLRHLSKLNLDGNPLNPELAEAYKQGVKGVRAYLRAKAKAQITLNEAKLILVGEGEVGKTCLMDALLGKPWQEHPSTHGIEIQQVKVNDPETQIEIALNSWDFGGQCVYRPTHQLFFSAPAVYLVVWKPREGPQQGFVKEWIQLIKRREPTAKILVVATHGGPQMRQPDIDRQELWDLFGKETVIDFFFVESKPDENGQRKGIEELKQAIARVAATLPEVGRSVPKSFQDVRKALQAKNVPYLSFDEVMAICREHKMDDEIARLFITISHRLGHLTHYQNDPTLRDIVILRPDWLATAMSYVLDDEETRKAHGLVKFSRLSQLWNDPVRTLETRYPEKLHRIFLRLMERFDLSYRVAGLSPDEENNPISLIAQLVPDNTPKEEDFTKAWTPELAPGDIQQTQICRIVDASNGQSANAEGLFYQLIVRLHRYSLGRVNYYDSIHWQRGLILDADYNGRALLRYIGNDVHITVRAAYPEYFLGLLTSEVRYLVESFWEGLRCDVTVPCIATPECKGLFEVNKLIENKKRNRHEQPCPICNEWQNIDHLLNNAPAASKPISIEYLERKFTELNDKVDESNSSLRVLRSQIDKQFADLIQLYTDDAKEGPRLFSLFPLDGNKFNPQTWMREKFRLVLWCEYSRLPLPAINGIDSKQGVYDFELDREWFKRAVPFLKFMTGTLCLVLPMVSSTIKVIDETAFKTLENQLSLGKEVIDAIAGEGAALKEVMGPADTTNLERGVGIRAENATLRELHALLKAKDPGFGGLVRVMNKRQEFLWVHPQFEKEY